jgi:flagellar L-ring protein precursor FlgH
MRPSKLLTGLVLTAGVPGIVCADPLWERRDPNTSQMFQDYRARKIGDVLTVVIDETTGFDAQEKRALDKQTNSNMGFSGSGTTSGGALQLILQSFGYSFNLQNQSGRTFNGTNNSSIDRKFTDRMSFIVVNVLPNGNLVVEGSRTRVITREVRTLRLRGVVRPADIGASNTLQSQFIADLHILYEGRGPESAYTNQNWGGRIFNKLWPF